jgi:valyl-tRNA synthetase
VQADGNVEVERTRLRKEVGRGERMLSNPGFTEKAPPEVVRAEREKLERYRRELDALGG